MSNGAMNQTSGIIPRRYKHGSIVYFEGDKSEYVYILKTGRIILTSRKVDTGEEVKEEIKPGEFFGVKSSLGKYPREETAQTVGETVLLVMTLADFERLVLQNVNVVRKMLRVFSNQLRRVNKLQREVLGEGESINQADEMYKIGEYYFEAGKEQQALYVFKRYMEYFPDGKYSGKSMQRIRAIETGAPVSDFGADMNAVPAETLPGRSDVDLTDFSIDDSGAAPKAEMPDFGLEPAAESPITSEIDDFFGSDKLSGLDDVTFDEPGAPMLKSKDVAELFYEAMSRFSQEGYEESLDMYSQIIAVKNLKNDAERKIYEKAHFEIGRCYLKLGKYGDALNAFSTMIKKFPNSDNIRNALFHIGVTYESVHKPEKAVAYYTKVASLDSKDSVGKLAVKRLRQLQNGQGKQA